MIKILNNDEILRKVNELKESVANGDDMDGGDMQEVVNNEGETLGVLPRGVIWENGLESYTKVVNVFLVGSDGELLIQIRSLKKKNWPGGFDFSCGENLKAGESFREGAERGIREELGIEVSELVEIGEFTPDEQKGLVCFGKVYKMLVDKNIELKVNPEETQEFRWMKPDEIRGLLKTRQDSFKRDFGPIFKIAFGE